MRRKTLRLFQEIQGEHEQAALEPKLCRPIDSSGASPPRGPREWPREGAHAKPAGVVALYLSLPSPQAQAPVALFYR